MEILSLSAMGLGTETISTSATGDFSSCQAETPPLDTKAVCVEHGVMCLGNWEMAEISAGWHILLPTGTKTQSGALVSPLHPSVIIPSSLHLLFRAGGIVFRISLHETNF